MRNVFKHVYSFPPLNISELDLQANHLPQLTNEEQ